MRLATALPAFLVGVIAIFLIVVVRRPAVTVQSGGSSPSPRAAAWQARSSSPAATPPVSAIDLSSSGSPVAWSPDGSLLAVQDMMAGASGNAARVSVVDRSGALVGGPFPGWSPTWLAPGVLAYVRPSADDESPHGPIVSRDVATGHETILWATTTNGSLLASGSGYVAVSEPATPSVIVLRRNSAGDATVVRRFARAAALDWSPSGQLLLELPASYDPNGGPAPAPLAVFDPATGSVTDLGGVVDPLPDARFSPDGRRISCICSATPPVEGIGAATVYDLGLRRWTPIAGGEGLAAFRHERLAWLDPTTMIVATSNGLLRATGARIAGTPTVIYGGQTDGVYATGGSSPVLYAIVAGGDRYRLVIVPASGGPAIDTGIVSDQSLSIVPNRASPIVAASFYVDSAWRRQLIRPPGP